ncbi:MAG: YlxM family DNA-binding protein [Peptococcaceae bacterium]|jgi:predicted DNA-binding protein YlxM (UPF0122 family)|nr:YlxM family DNA-binding protein [Peptococcaceae bacterium]
MDKRAKMALLADFYGPLLTDKQRMVWDFYFSEDLSLQEIARSEGISRQAVHDLLKRTEKLLTEYEAKLGLMERFLGEQQNLNQALKLLKPLEKEDFRAQQRWEDFSLARRLIADTLAEFVET